MPRSPVSVVMLLFALCALGACDPSSPTGPLPDAIECEDDGPNSLCDNGLDDDEDGATDYPGDVGCATPMDADEAP